MQWLATVEGQFKEQKIQFQHCRRNNIGHRIPCKLCNNEGKTSNFQSSILKRVTSEKAQHFINIKKTAMGKFQGT